MSVDELRKLECQHKMTKELINIEEMLKGGEPCDINEKVQRKMEVADLKEVYAREYLLETGLVTEEEYNTIPASTSRKDDFERAQGIAEIMHHVVGF